MHHAGVVSIFQAHIYTELCDSIDGLYEADI